MPGKFPYSKRYKYPRLRSEEVAIWERFIDLHPGFFDSVDYDVPVGTPREYPEIKEEKIKAGMELLSRKRIDVVGFKNEKVFIVEIKPNALLEAFGQLMGEKDLWIKENPEKKEVSMVLITDKENPDIKELSLKYEVYYFVV